MSDKPTWRIARLDEMDRRGSDLPIREYLGIHAFGFNIRTPEGGILVNEHDEASTGQEELYVVLDGTVTFEIDGEAVEAKPGTLLSVAPESSRKATGEGTVLVIGGKPGEAYQGIDWGDAWPFHRDSLTAYREQRYADAFQRSAMPSSRCPTTLGFTTTTPASPRSPATPATTHSPTSDNRSSCSRVSATTHAETTTSPRSATTPASSKPLAEPLETTRQHQTSPLAEHGDGLDYAAWPQWMRTFSASGTSRPPRSTRSPITASATPRSGWHGATSCGA